VDLATESPSQFNDRRKGSIFYLSLKRGNFMTTALQQTFFKDFARAGVGFDSIFDRMTRLHDEVSTKTIPNYPPYNIKKTDEYTYVIEMAVAGFAKEDITIETKDGSLVIMGEVKDAEPNNDEALYHGLAFRPFTRKFTLNEQVEVKSAEMVNGLLKLTLERIVPESKKTKQISIM
jgi:molecular chaperone IbpA